MTVKRVLDLFCTAIGLVLLAPLFAIVAILIKLDDGGPVFYRQRRVGRGGRSFAMYKFRSMRVRSDEGALLTVGADPRITRVGFWIRRFKVDELPQLFNVLTGEMTLVGPRPEVERYVDLYSAEQRRVLDLTPGITDPASIRFWDESRLLAEAGDPERYYVSHIMPEKLRIQLAYADEQSVWSDLLVVLHTLRRLWPEARPVLLDRILTHRKILIIASHVVLFIVGWRLAFDLRFDFEIPPSDLILFWTTLPVVLAVRLFAHAAFGLYSGYWRHVGLSDLANLVKAATAGLIVIAGILYMDQEWRAVPRSVLLIEWAATILLSGGVRFVARYFKESQVELVEVPGRATLVIGTGNTAERLLREARRDGRRAIRVVGLISVGQHDHDVVMHGVRVRGTLDTLAAHIAELHAEFLVIALDAPDATLMDRVVKECVATGIQFKTMPTLEELLQGTGQPDQLREVRIEDLLGRTAVTLDLTRIAGEVGDAVVLVTGAGGSIGSELARQVARFDPRRLILLDQAESPLYFTHLELAGAYPGLDLRAEVCDIGDESSMTRVFRTERPDIVFHAAAYKHVPLMESNIVEAVRNNVLGTLLVAENAAAAGARKFVLISTDKAVNPSSIMGATKRVAERLVLELPSFRGGRTDFRAVRFGNVLGSNGSVIPLFERQLRAGGPLTVTHREVERYFMTIPEAVQLVLAAAVVPEAADCVTMLEMGEPVRIVELAEKLIRLSGREPYRDVPIVFTGLRPGEKLKEELMSSVEETIPTTVANVKVVHLPSSDGRVIEEALDSLMTAVALGDQRRVLAALRSFVPEYVNPAEAKAPAADRDAPARHRRVPA
jgi:FlaA1/EpsC-like NDP-sugar epimerase/lipopolysaccharide/colanic/teichoic acid biosynthesis glycosyltransferase